MFIVYFLQYSLLIVYVAIHWFLDRYHPIILTGDFNLKPSNGVYKLITQGRLDYEGMSRRVLREPTMKDKNVLPRTLLPQRLGITDRCQHDSVLNARVRNQTTASTGVSNLS